MKQKGFLIGIPSPCHEDWDKMSPTECGAFCHSCQKEVIDFSIMTDKEVIEYLSGTKNVCGNFREDQLERRMSLIQVRNGFLKWKAVLLGVLSLAAFKNAIGGTAYKAPAPMYDQAAREIHPDTIIAPVVCKITVHGAVLNERGEKFPEAVVGLADSTGYTNIIETQTDSNGHFTLIVTEDKMRLYPLHLKASYWDYRSKTISLTDATEQNVTVILDEYRPKLRGKVMLRP